MRTERIASYKEPSPIELTSVMLDIGGGFGALIVHASADDDDRQLDIVDERGRRQHAVVRRVTTANSESYQAVFPSLQQGSYSILDGDDTQLAQTTIEDGEVTDVALVEGPTG